VASPANGDWIRIVNCGSVNDLTIVDPSTNTITTSYLGYGSMIIYSSGTWWG
jgi:hypothetical protein